MQFNLRVFIRRMFQTKLTLGALQKPRALPPTNNSGKEKLPSKRKKPSCCWPAGWRRRRRGGQIEKRRDHKSSKYNKLSIQEMCWSVGSEVGRSRHSYEVGNSCRWIRGGEAHKLHKCGKEKILYLLPDI